MEMSATLYRLLMSLKTWKQELGTARCVCWLELCVPEPAQPFQQCGIDIGSELHRETRMDP